MFKRVSLYLLVLLAQIVMSCSGNKDGRIILIPKGYEGIVVIIYDVKDGAEKEYENGKQVFRIPVNGVLKTQFSLDATWVESDDINYFYENGRRTEITRVDFPSEIPSSTVQIIGEQVGVTSGIANTYFSFLVCPNNKSDSLSRLRERLDFKELITK